MDASLKQRLIGAAVLILLAVIFLPLLVKGPAPESGVAGVSLKIPAEPKSEGGMVTQDLPLTAPVPPVAGNATGMPSAVAAPAEGDAPAAESVSEPPMAAVAAGDFAVSFGSYATAADADKVIAALAAAGLPGYRETAVLGTRQAQRVRIGPFADQAAAESARLRAGQVRNDVQAKVIALNAQVAAAPAAVAAPTNPEARSAQPPAAKPVPEKPVTPAVVTKPAEVAKPTAPAKVLKPEAPAEPKPSKPEPPAAKPANPAKTGFVVQIGAFSSAADATTQRDTLRKAGFNAFTDSVPGANGPLTRVRVGPVMTRAEADALKEKLKAQTGKDGMVRPHP